MIKEPRVQSNRSSRRQLYLDLFSITFIPPPTDNAVPFNSLSTVHQLQELILLVIFIFYKFFNDSWISCSSNQISGIPHDSPNISYFSSVPTTQRQSDIQQVSSDGVVGTPINFHIPSKIEGNESQILTTIPPTWRSPLLCRGIWCMIYMTAVVETSTCLPV